MLTFVSLAQVSYPIAQVIDGDTIVLITPIQLKYANTKIIQVDYLSKKVITLEEFKLNLEKSIKLKDVIIDESRKQLNLYNQNVESYIKLIEDKDNTIKTNIKQAKKDKFKAIVTTGLIGILVGIGLSFAL